MFCLMNFWRSNKVKIWDSHLASKEERRSTFSEGMEPNVQIVTGHKDLVRFPTLCLV